MCSSDLKKAGRPWDMAKGFDDSAPVGAITPVSHLPGHPVDGAIALWVNDELRQSSDLSAMTWNVAEVLSHLSRLVTLQPGDLVFTGTPEGVGPVHRGDRVRAGCNGCSDLNIRIR